MYINKHPWMEGRRREDDRLEKLHERTLDTGVDVSERGYHELLVCVDRLACDGVVDQYAVAPAIRRRGARIRQPAHRVDV